MKISIVTASFNQGQFIEETIESILSQEGDFFIEYFIFDGGSTDRTVEILKKYDTLLAQKAYPVRCSGVSFSWVSEKDRGQSHAINKGLKKATGDIVALLSSDDQYEPNAFRVVAEEFSKDPSLDLVHGDAFFLNAQTGVRTLHQSADISVSEMTTTLARINDPSVFYRHRLIKKIGFLDEKLYFAMVYEFLVRALSHGNARYIHRPLVTFRLWENSKTVTQKKSFITEIDYVHKKHGLSILNPKRIQHITSRRPFSFLRHHFPWVYGLIKKVFYSLIKKIRY